MPVSTEFVLGAAGGSYIVVGVVVVLIVGLIAGFYTRTGSGIDDHPSDGGDGAPGAKGASEPSGQDQGEGSAFSTHGTG
jgi:hypothetical protein